MNEFQVEKGEGELSVSLEVCDRGCIAVPTESSGARTTK